MKTDIIRFITTIPSIFRGGYLLSSFKSTIEDFPDAMQDKPDIAITGLSKPEYVVYLIILMHASVFTFLIARKILIVFVVLAGLILLPLLLRFYTYTFKYNTLFISGKFMIFRKGKGTYKIFDIAELTDINDIERGFFSFSFNKRYGITAYLSIDEAEACKIADHVRLVCGDPSRRINYSSTFRRTKTI